MAETQLRIGLLINPIAGMGGAVGLKGSDGDRAERAKALGAHPQAAVRVHAALAEVLRLEPPVVWYTAGGDMGAHILQEMGLRPRIVYEPRVPSSGADTQRAAQCAMAAGIDLLLFAGGDGTARDVLASVGKAVPVLGIPAGVKMHSAVFAVTPRTAGDAVRLFLSTPDAVRPCAQRAVMDREFMPDGQPASSPQLYGYLKTPQMPSLMQAAKASPGPGGDGAVLAVLPKIAQELRQREVVLLGPGATLHALKAELGFEGSLLGVDVFIQGQCAIYDAREDQIWMAIQGKDTVLALGVIGGQGFLIGRGNQQLSPRILKQVSPKNLRVLASDEKLVALPAMTLYVDSGDESVDTLLSGYLPVITGIRRSTVCRVACGRD